MTINRQSGVMSSSLPQMLSLSRNGKIHSRFKHSFNIGFESSLVNVGRIGSPLSSFGVNLGGSVMDAILPNLETGDLAIVRGSKILIYTTYGGVVEIALDKFDTRDLNIRPIQPEPERIDAIYWALDSIPGLENDLGLPLNDDTKTVLKCLIKPDITKEKMEAAFDYLIGRGKGLTPSGDDVLFGYIVMHKLFGNPLPGDDWRDRYSNKTTVISANYFRLLYKGVVSEYLQDFCESARVPNTALLKQSVDQIKKVGATSGSDMLFGMSLGIYKISGATKLPQILEKVLS